MEKARKMIHFSWIHGISEDQLRFRREDSVVAVEDSADNIIIFEIGMLLGPLFG